jgi:hypothetical protein
MKYMWILFVVIVSCRGKSQYCVNVGGHRGRDRMEVGFYNYLSNQCCEFEPRSCEVYLTTLCDKVCHWLAAGRFVFSGYSGFLHQ